MPRPCLLTPQLREWIEDELAAGASQAVVAQRAGISLRTVERWLAEGRVRRPEPPAPPEDDSWRIAASLLAQMFPARWGPPTEGGSSR
jgi:DNA invertase Pin-like site-specific DNA recombinase